MRLKNPQKALAARRSRRRARVRAKITGTAARPRLVASRSLKHIRAQLIDDARGATLVAASDLDLTAKDIAAVEGKSGKVARAYAVGLLLAARAKKKDITAAVFDRAGRKYHGRVRALAEGARAGGLIL